MIKLLYPFIGTILLLSACKEKQPTLSCKDPNKDFLFKDCLCQQVQSTELVNKKLHKWVRLNGKEEEKVIAQMDSLEWEKELALFFNSDIKNTTANKFYELEKICLGASGEVCHTNYRLKEGEHGDISFIQISTTNELIDSVEVCSNTNNYIYKGEKKLKFIIDNSQGKPILQSFKIVAFQDVVTKEKDDFFVQAEVLSE